MANKYDIIHIDFQASARGANAAIESIRKEAETSSAKINQLKQDIDKALKSGASDEVINDLRAQRKAEEKRYGQLSKAQNELIKGMRVLDEGVKQFNNGALSQMNAAFQKSVNNAAKLAQSKMTNGTKEWREMAAIMQETEQNYARMQRDTDLLIENLQNGGTVFRKTLEDEKKGLNDLLQVLPYMGTEYRKIEEQLQFLVKTTDEMAIKERQLKGEIVTTNDARRVRLQLTKEGAEAARQAADAAQVEIDEGKKLVDTYEKEREGIEAKAKASAEAAAKYTEELQMYDDLIDIYEKEIKANKRSFKERQQKAEQLRAEANEAKNNAEAQREAQKIVDKAYDDTKAKVENLKQQLKDLKAGVTTEAPKVDPVTEGIKQGAEAAGQSVDELKQKIASLTAEQDQLKKDWLGEMKKKYPHQRYDSYDEFAKDTAFSGVGYVASDYGKSGSFRPDKDAYLEEMHQARRKFREYMIGDEVLGSSAYRDREEIAKGGIDMSDPSNDYMFGPDMAQNIIDGEKAYEDACNKVEKAIIKAHEKLRKAFDEGLQPKQLEGVAKQLRNLQDLYFNLTTPTADGWTFAGSGKGIIADILGKDLDQELNKIETNIKRAMTIAEKNKDEFYQKEYGDEQEKAKQNLTTIETRQAQVKEELAKAQEQLAAAEQKGTEAKKEEVKVDEQVVETQKQEQVTAEQLNEAIAQQKKKLEELEAEKKAIIEAQQESAKATNAEAEAYKSLTKEQAEAKLKEKQALSTFKSEGGTWKVTNREEAQQYLFKALGEIEPTNVGKSHIQITSTDQASSEEKIAQLLGMFKSRYGMKSDDDAMGAIRELLSGGGLIKGGGMNKFLLNLDQDTEKLKSYNNEIKALTDIVNADTAATDTNTEKKRTLAEVEAEINKIEGEKTANVKLLRKLNEGEIKSTEEKTKKTTEDTKAKKENVEVTNAEIEAIKKLSKEKALAMKAEMTNPSKVDYKAGKLDASNIEEVQSFIISRMKKIEPRNIKGDTLSLGGEQIDRLVKDFQDRYGFKGEPKKAKDLLKQIVQGQEGLFKGGGQAEFSQFGSFIVNVDADAYKTRITKLQELVKITSDTTQATDKLTDATKNGTEASKESTKAIDEQIAKVNQRYEAYQAKEQEYNDKMAELEKKRKAMSSLPKSGPDAGLQRTQLEDEIKDYNENVVAPARREKNKLKKLWEKSAQELVEMQGIEQEAPTRRSTKAKNDDTKAIKDNTQATEENTQARRKNAKTSEEEAQRKQKELELKQQLADAEKELSDADKKKKEEERKTTRKDRESENLQQKAAEAERNVGGKAEESLKNLKEAQELREQLKADNKNTLKNNEDNQKQLADINEKLKEQTDRIRENEQIKAQANTQGIEKTEQAIRLLQEENRHIDTNSKEWKDNKDDITALQEALNEMKGDWMSFADAQKIATEANKRGADQFYATQEQMGKALDAFQRERIKQLQKIESIKRKTGDEFDPKALGDAYKELEALDRQYEKLMTTADRLKREGPLTLMEARMQRMPELSDKAFVETKKFWQAVQEGAEKGSEAYILAQDHLEKMIEVEKQRNKEALRDKASRIGAGTSGTYHLSSYSLDDISESIEAAKKYRGTLHESENGEEIRQLSKDIVNAEAYLKSFNEELERAKRNQEDMDALMRKQLEQGTSLSESALKAQERYWQHLIDDPKTAAESLEAYKKELETVHSLQKQQADTANRANAQKILSGTLGNYSEQEIRESIDAAKALRNEMKSGSDEAARYAVAIAKAESHIKNYGVEAARSALQQKQSDKRMQDQLNRMIGDMQSGSALPTESQLKAQHQYWQRLIDDPKTAAKSLSEYRARLAEVEELEKNIVEIRGKAALSWFQDGRDKNASENTIKEVVSSLKEYRATLLKETDADKIAQIDAYLQRVGASAKKAAEDVMSLDDALELAEKAAGDIYGSKNPAFLASPEEIQAATKSIEKYREELFKTIKQKRDMGQATEAEEEELKELAKYLKDLKFEQDNFNMSREKMEELMKTPTNAVNLDELRAAIKRADAELKRMEGSLGDNSEEYKRFAEQVKGAKNVLKEMEGQAKATTSVWEKAWSRLKTYVGMYMGFNMAWQRVTGAFEDLMTLSDKMGEVRKTTDLSTEAVGRLSDRLAKLDVRTPLEQLMEISAAAGQLGLKSEEDIMGFTEAANKMMIALPEMGKEAATQMMRVAIATGEVDRIKKQMEEGTIEGSSATAVAMEKIASTIDRLRASSASTAPEITDFVKRVGAVGAQSGISIDQVAALGSTISSLGMRVEMSATAISRMIPAIKNNAFAVANAIGVAPDALRSLFEAGRGMEAILMIFQHLKDQNMNADSIEKLLGIGGMQDVMKQLNQQGARAGIVFAGLSQNVDVLRQQLVTANQAYEKNMAITEEFNKMNDTTAAKWQRLKNEFEEAFVSDTAQRWLGGLIDGLKWVIDLLIGKSGLSSALFTIITLFGILKLEIISSIWKGFTFALLKIIDLFRNWRVALELLIIRMKAMTLAQWGNVFLAVAAAVGMLIYKLQQLSERAAIVTNELAKAAEETLKQTAAVNKLFHAVAKTNVEYENAKKKLEGVKQAAGDTAEAENKLKKASADHAAAIRDINSKYGTYLGYMLSETASAQQLASARELINKKLRETITLKQQEAALGNVEQEYGGKVNKKASSMEKTLQTFFGSDYERSAQVSVAISEAAQTYAKDSKSFQAAVKNILTSNKIQAEVVDEYMGTFEGYRKSVEEYQRQEDLVNRRFEATNKANRKQTREAVNKDLNAILADYQDLLLRYQKAEGEEKKNLAAEVYKQQRSYINAVNNNADYLYDSNKSVIDSNIKKMQFFEKGLRSVADEAIRTYDAMERAETKVTGLDLTNDGDSADNPWGGSHEGASTDWKNMTANQLVERRKQMNEFVKAIQTDSDVQTVLNEDAALKAAIEKGMSSDMRTVIDWYNTERLKIQDELHARYLTNTGDWMDPKKSRARKKRLQDDMRAYLEELDAYYTERKTKIQEAGNEEGVTEAEVRNRTLANEMEWRQRRAELQLMYSRKAKTITEDEQNAIAEIIASRTGDDMNFIRKTIAQTVKFSEAIRDANEQGAKEYRKFQGDLDLGSEKDYNKEQMALRQHLKAIQDIIDKERPFNGITKNLRENLVTMGVLTADMTKERDRLMKENADMTEFNARQAAEEVKRTVFMLGEAEHAYTTTIEQVMRRMADAGMQAWADELRKSPKMQEGMLAQLRQTYDEVQEAIKKEASLMKKQAENMWNSILLPGGDGKTTIKDAFEQTLSQLGIAQGRVSRANGLVGAGVASERVADKIAIKQMQLQLTMQKHYYNLMRKQGMQRIKDLERQIELAKQEGDIEKAKRLELDKQHADMSLRLAMTKEQTDLLKQQEEIIARTEESQNRLYTALREWAELLSSSLQGVFEATHAGDAEYYNELAKLNLTGKGGPGAGTYIVIDNEGTSDATAHYEYLDEREALERQHEIERENAQAEAWKKLMDDLNMKMSEQITDWLNASMQSAAIDANTQAVLANTEALYAAMGKGNSTDFTDVSKLQRDEKGMAVDKNGKVITPIAPAETEQPDNMPKPFWQMTEEDMSKAQENIGTLWQGYKDMGITAMQEMADATADLPDIVTSPFPKDEKDLEKRTELIKAQSQAQKEASTDVTKTVVDNNQQQQQSTQQTNKKEEASGLSMYAKLTQAANLYGIAYQTMSNDNLSASQKFQMMALQAAGQAAIAMLTADLSQSTAETTNTLPVILAKCLKINPIWGSAIFAALSATIGGLMGMAVSKIAKSKSEISQVTGASASAGRLSTGMMTYAEGNVNEFTDPATLTPGRSYNVDAADGRTYRAKYTGTNPRTHLTNGPEFHLAGERGREMIIDAGTTREITMNETEIWHAIQTLRNGGHVSSRRGSRRGVRAFADGNVEDFETMDMTQAAGGLSPEMAEKFQTSIDRNNDLLERALTEGIKGVFNVYGKGGMVDTYDTAKKSLKSHGERY